MIFRLGELFSGPGGLAYGAKLAGFTQKGEKWGVEHAWANDMDESACKTYRRNICPKTPEQVMVGKVEDLKIGTLPPIDAFAFGFPCNDFSAVGEQKGFHGKYGPLYSYGVKVIDTFRPKWFLAENVSGLANANSGKAFEKILHDLRNAGNGYNLTVNLYKFEHYGVPQTRHRIIVVGIAKEFNLEFKVPAPTTLTPISVKDALSHPPIPKNASNQELTKQSALVIERLTHIPAGKNAWYENLPKHLQLNVRGARLSQIYKRLSPDAPSYTITGSGGGGTHVYHWNEPRALTNRERARIQTFPDKFVFEGSKEDVRKQIGMAVPPVGAKVIIRAIFNTFAGKSYPSVPPTWKEKELQSV